MDIGVEGDGEGRVPVFHDQADCDIGNFWRMRLAGVVKGSDAGQRERKKERESRNELVMETYVTSS